MVAAQRARRSREDLIANTPADGLVAGLARVNGDLFGPERSRCAVLSYDYSVLAGTQGQHEPPQEGPPLRASSTACDCPWSSSPRGAGGVPETPTSPR